MKKVLFVLAFVVAYGVSMAMTNTDVVTIMDTQTTIVADVDGDNIVPEGEKEKEKAKKSKADAKGEGCSGEKTADKA